jgi:hypothetical protein
MSLFEQIRGRSHIRVHSALSISGAIALENGFAGVNRKLLKDDASGLPIHIPSTTLMAGDRVDVCIRNVDTPILSFVVPTPHDIKQPLSRFIDAERVPEGFGELFYRVNGAESAHLKILVRKRSPGGVDPSPARAGHGWLSAPQPSASEVDDSQDVTVTVPAWRAMRPGHRVHLQVSDRCLPHTVTSGEEGEPIIFTIAKEQLAALGHCDALLFYKLWDEVGNPATDRSQTSHLRIRPSTVRALGNAQQAPVILGMNQENVIDLAALDGDHVTVEVDVAANGLTTGQQIKLYWRGEPIVGPLQLLTWTQPVGQASNVIFTIPRTELSPLVGSWISAAWTLVGGDEHQASPAAECLLLDSLQVMALEGEDPSILDLTIPFIPEGVEPVEGSDARVGIPKKIYDDRPEGLKVIIDPWYLIEAHDTCRLRLNGESVVDIKTVLPGEERNRLTLYVQRQLLLDGINTLAYSVQRISEITESSEEWTMLYHEIRPGGKDLDPGTEGHSELELGFPIEENGGIDIVKQGLGGSLTTLTVHCRYPFCRPYDTIKIAFGGHAVSYLVSFDEAPPVASITPWNVTVSIDKTQLDKIENRRAVPVKFTVTDLVHNGTDPSAIWSAITYIDVDRLDQRFKAPVFREDPADAADAPEIIDLTKLDGRPLLLMIPIDPRFKKDDEVRAVFENSPDPDYPLRGIVETDEWGDPKRLVLEIPNDRLAAGKKVSARYDVYEGPDHKNYSHVAFAQVVGFGKLQLPDLLEARGTGASQLLPPLDAVDGATVRIVVAGLLGTDKIQLIFNGTPYLDPVPGEIDGGVDIPIPPSTIAANIGNGANATFTLQYQLLRDSDVFPSGIVTVTVTPLPTESLNSPVFFINDIEERYSLDLNSFIGDATIRAKSWPFIAAGQQVRMTLEGKTAGGLSSTLTLWDGGADTVTDQWVVDRYKPVTVARSYLDTLGNGTQLVIRFSVSLDLADNPNTDIDFPDRVYRVGMVGQAPVITMVKANDIELPNGGETSLSLITVTGTITPSRPVDVYDGIEPLGAARVTGTTWTFGPLDFLDGVHALTAQVPDERVPSAPWLFKIVTDAQGPTITAVTTAEGNVPDGGSTYYRNAIVTGTGTSGKTVELLDNNVSVGRYVPRNGEWSAPTRLFSATTHTLTVRTIDGSNKSFTHVFKVEEGLDLHIVRFSEQRDDGWAWGGAGAEQDVQWITYPGRGYYHRLVLTHTHQSAGLVLFSVYASLTPGATYLLSTNVFRDNGPFSSPQLQLGTSAGDRSAIHTLAAQYAETSILLEFVASSPTMMMQLINHESSGEGNDFALGHIQLQRTKLPS